MSQKSTMASVVIVDAHRFRRAAISFLLKEWAAANHLVISGAEPWGWPEELNGRRTVRLVIYVSGATLVSSEHNLTGIQNVLTRAGNAPLVIVTDTDSGPDILAAFHAGARAYVSTSMDPALTLRVLTFVLEGGTYFPADTLLGEQYTSLIQIRAINAPSIDERPLSEKVALTNRQLEVAHLLRHGLSNKSIARSLDMAEATVKVHVRQIMRKLGVHNRTQAALISGGNESATGPVPERSTYRFDN